MRRNCIDFLLSVDAGRARRARRLLAEKAPGISRTAGTWPELMAQVATNYLLPGKSYDWTEMADGVATAMQDGFWASSLEVAPQETMAELQAALIRLLETEGPTTDRHAILNRLPTDSRPHNRLADLILLAESIGKLPWNVQQMADLLASQATPLRPVRVYHRLEPKDLNAWQNAVLTRLEQDAPPPDPDLIRIIESAETSPVTTHTTLKSARTLFDDSPKPPKKVDNIRVLAVRDCLAEVEISAGLIQQALESGNNISDIGLLLPDDPLCQMTVAKVYSKTGIPLSGFRRPTRLRDLGREAVRCFLLCLRKPAPIMAIASLLSSPLMPWSGEEGHALAQAAMNGDVLLKSTRKPPAAQTFMALLEQKTEAPADLQRSLNRFASLGAADKMLFDHLQRFSETIKELQTLLAGMGELDWDTLLQSANPAILTATQPEEYWQEGLPVFQHGLRPWCSVRHLFIIGFNEGCYPAGVGTSAVFTEAEWDEIAAAGWPVRTNACLRQSQRQLFADQLAAATESMTFLFARRSTTGQALEPSSSLNFLARSLGVEADKLIYDLDRSDDLRRIPDLPLAAAAPASPPRQLVVKDIELGSDLLQATGRDSSDIAPLSPSAAETLMVSPFAWLLKRLGCLPREWTTDAFDVMTAGTLAHHIFENIFQPGMPIPSEDEIVARMLGLLNDAILTLAPYLRSAEWRVERYKFESEVLLAAVHWQKLLTACNGSIVGAEQWLRGWHGMVPLHGQCDLLVGLPSGKLLVVDYKKSSSGKRRDRMRSGFDLQAHLYREMIQTGGLQGFDPPLENIGVVYYLMNDTRALADSPIDDDGTVVGWEVLDNDTSSEAIQHLDHRLDQVRHGMVPLNTADDEKWWEKTAALPLYALDDSPLLRLFMHPGKQEEAP